MRLAARTMRCEMVFGETSPSTSAVLRRGMPAWWFLLWLVLLTAWVGGSVWAARNYWIRRWH